MANLRLSGCLYDPRGWFLKDLRGGRVFCPSMPMVGSSVPNKVTVAPFNINRS